MKPSKSLLVAAAALAIVAIWTVGRDRWTDREPSAAPARRPAAVERIPTRGDPPGSFERESRPPASSPVAPASGERARTWIVRVEDELGEPVVGASIDELVGELARSLGATGDRGELALARRADDLVELRVARAGFETRCIHARAAVERVVVVLRRAAALNGVVVLPTRASAGAGCVVVAYPAAWWPDVSRIDATGESPRSYPVAVSDAAGRFELDGLAQGERYALIAAGNGLATRSAVECVAPSDAVTVPMRYAFGLRLRLDGVPANQHVTKWGDRSGTGWSMPRELRATALGVGSATACLLAELCRDGAPSPSHDLEWIYVGDAPEKQLGPLSFHSKPPGYLEIATPLWLAPIDPCIESRALVLRSDGSPRGTLSLVFRGGELWERWRGAASDAAFALDLIDREGGGHYEVHRLDARSDASVEHVPIGSYTLALRGSGNFFELPRDAPIELEIRAGSTTTIEVDVGELGGLRLIAPELGGVVLRETVQLALRRLPKRNVATANLVGRDLVWLALAPGDYEVVVNGGSFGRALELGSVTIAPGELATIALPAR